MFWFCACLIAALIAEPVDSKSSLPVATVQKENDQTRERIKFSGVVVDDDDSPIEGASVIVGVFETKYGTTHSSNGLGREEMVTDSSGRYSVEIELPQNSEDNLWIHIRANIEGCWESRQSIRRSKLELGKEVPNMRLTKGLKIQSRLLPQIGSATEIESGKVYVYSKVVDLVEGQPSFIRTYSKLVDTNAHGNFEVFVPPNSESAFAATAEGFAVATATLGINETNLDEILLPTGAVVMGALMNAEGKPLPGVVIQLEQKHGIRVGRMPTESFVPVRSTAVTDDDGKFRFPHHNGECTIKVGLNRGSTFSKSRDPDPERIPLVMPVKVKLNAEEKKHVGLILREEKARNITGKICMPDGSPAVGVEAVVSIMPGGSSIAIMGCKTDENGSYSLQVPMPAKKIGVRIYGKPDPSGRRPTGKLDEHPKATRRYQGSAWFQVDEDNDLVDANWTMSPMK